MKSKEDKKQREDNEIVEDKRVICKNGTLYLSLLLPFSHPHC